MGAVPERFAALLDPEQHPSALERAAIANLSRGELAEAFRLADRRCRILPVAQARHYTLRAEIAHRSGFMAAALKDIAKALELAPDDLSANRRLMQWGDDEQREAAARRLIERDRDMTVLGEAVARLKAEGETALGAIHRVGDSITGWAVWQGRGQMSLRIENGAKASSYPVESDPQHVLAGKAEHAASFSAPFPSSTTRRVVSLRFGRRTIVNSVFPAPLAALPVKHGKAVATKSLARTKQRAVEVTVIVPVYDDFEATRGCLESLTKAIAGDDRTKVLLVDDATPDRRIAALLDSVASLADVQLIRNTDNLGFIGAVNRALDAVPAGDVILLNSDTLVPKGFVKRLRKAAHSSPDIGTVTPLSNNGEATSLPLPFAPNPLLSPEDIGRLDKIAARVNADQVVDMPDGIGFCLYITRACLDAVGGLSDHYHRGYLEDVDLCLRARQHGFRNVCASSVYMGHSGSASFKTEKRALVVLNLARLRLRFPDYRNESATFKALDPLKHSRGAIERELIAERRGTTLVLSGAGAVMQVAKQFAVRSDQPAILASLDRGSAKFILRDAGSDFPQSLDFQLPADEHRLFETLTAIAPQRLLIADPADIPAMLVRPLIDQGAMVDLLVADGSLWCSRGGLDPRGRVCPAILQDKECNCSSDTSGSWLKFLTRDSRILAPDAAAEAFSRRRLPSKLAKQVSLVDCSGVFHKLERPSAVTPRGEALGVLPVGLSALDFAFMRDLIRRIRQERPETGIVVLGETLNDLALMALGDVVVTGAVSATDLPGTAALHGLGGVLIARRAPLFGHPLVTAAFAELDVPLAFFDWSFGKVVAHGADLPMTPSSEVVEAAEDLLGWSARQW
ncbi:glycosyltransferase [Bradyrhizobium sp. 62]|uniref:glycosyltransferase n=1 Tax=Bradyrhizobium sp. 62 TaxID=1043588 RepID=UPI001FFA09C0|nr:glycosyltransferase [Bradyrhizobium sp. 62]MCK1368327.1 glycosyltransferase [Bradyrhizobium sp. 62]